MFSSYNSAFKNILYPTFKDYDLFYKTNCSLSRVKTLGLLNSSVLSIVFRDTKLSNNKLASTVFGFGLQLLRSRFGLFYFLFGFKYKVKFTSFIMRKQETFNDLSSFFFANLIHKAILLGMFKFSSSSKNYVVKFFVSDVFNFFGVRFFSKFYLDFFDWPAKLVFTNVYFNFDNKMSVPVFLSIFKILII